MSHTRSLRLSRAVNFQRMTQNILGYATREYNYMNISPMAHVDVVTNLKKVYPITREMRLYEDTCEYHHVRNNRGDAYTQAH